MIPTKFCSVIKTEGTRCELHTGFAICHYSYWQYVTLVVSGIVVVGVCNRCQMRTSKCTCLIFGVSIGLDPS